MRIDKKTVIVSGFPGTGKSYYVNYAEGSGYMPQGFAIDSDSSKFNKSNFPSNYIEHIKNNIGKVKIIFVSSHKEVRDAMVKNNIHFTLAYPNKSLKIEYLKRYANRGSSVSFIDLIYKNWDNWLNELQAQKNCKHLVLNEGEYLSTALKL